jgi:hypothetical protein
MTRRPAHPLDDQILAVLRDSEGFPLATADVVAGVGARPASNRAYTVLRRLHILAGRTPPLVHRSKVDGFRSVYWVAVPIQLELEPGPAWEEAP